MFSVSKDNGATMTANGQAGQTGVDESKMPSIDVTGSAKYYDQYSPAAKAWPGPILPFRADAGRVYHNIADGVAAVLSCEEQILQELPAFNLDEVRELPNLAMAVVYSTSVINRLTGSESSAAERRNLQNR